MRMATALLVLLCLAACRFDVPLHTTVRIRTATLTHTGLDFGSGTAFAVAYTKKGGTLLLTAAHVAAPGDLLAVQIRERKAIERAKLVAWDATADLALFEISVRLPMLVPLGAPPRLGQRVWAITFDMGGKVIVTGIVSTDAIDTCEEKRPDVKCRLTTLPTGPGYSGAAVVDRRGRLVGLLTAYVKTMPHLGIFVGVETIIPFLRRHIGGLQVGIQ